MSAVVFEAYGQYYDALYGDKDYIAEVEYISGLLSRYGSNCKSLLEFGSGTGKHGRLLAGKGYQVDGVERSHSMFAAARSAPGFDCRLGDARSIKMGRSFDAVLALFHVLNYQTGNDDVQAFFANAASHLERGGLFIFDTWYSPAVYSLGVQARVKRVIQDDLVLVRSAEPTSHPNHNRIDVKYSLTVWNHHDDEVNAIVETHGMRHFSLPEIDLLSQMHGFEMLGAEAFMTGAQPGETTWSVTVVLRKL